MNGRKIKLYYAAAIFFLIASILASLCLGSAQISLNELWSARRPVYLPELRWLFPVR